MTTATAITTEKAFKVALKFVAGKTAIQRPALQGVFYRPDGAMIASDGMQMILIRDAHDATNGPILDKNNKNIEAKYFEVDRIIPKTSTSEINKVDVQKWLDAAESLATLAEKKSKGIEVAIQADHYTPVTLKSENKLVGNGNWTMDEMTNGTDLDITVNSIYLINTMKAFKALGYQTVNMKFNGPKTPFLIESSDEKVQCVVAPINKR